jgi:transposase
MAETLNAALPRRSLGWRTAQELWRNRPSLAVDRSAFRDEVRERAHRLALTQPKLQAYDGLVERFAIETALADRGWLKRQRGGWC